MGWAFLAFPAVFGGSLLLATSNVELIGSTLLSIPASLGINEIIHLRRDQ
jgi:hypothetical protein